MRVRKRMVSIRVDEGFYDKLEKEKNNWMKKQGLTRLSTRAFTKIIAKNNLLGEPNVKKQKRRRK